MAILGDRGAVFEPFARRTWSLEDFGVKAPCAPRVEGVSRVSWCDTPMFDPWFPMSNQERGLDLSTVGRASESEPTR